MLQLSTKFLILLTSIINIEWIKANLIDMDLFYKIEEFNKILEVFFSLFVVVRQPQTFA
jgi:hypothetical protein